MPINDTGREAYTLERLSHRIKTPSNRMKKVKRRGLKHRSDNARKAVESDHSLRNGSEILRSDSLREARSKAVASDFLLKTALG